MLSLNLNAADSNVLTMCNVLIGAPGVEPDDGDFDLLLFLHFCGVPTTFITRCFEMFLCDGNFVFVVLRRHPIIIRGESFVLANQAVILLFV